MCKKIFALSFVFLFFVISLQSLSADQQSNFNIAPSPIAYPYFDTGRSDSEINGSYVSIKMDSFSLVGGFFDFKGRHAFNDFLAIDGELGLGLLGGSMPGIGPSTLIPAYNTSHVFVNYWDIRVDGKSSMTFINLRPTFNLEVQPIHTQVISLILFGGLNFSYSNFEIKTPFSLLVPVGFTSPPVGTAYSGYTDDLSTVSTLIGAQFGVQLDIPLSDSFRLSPFFMMSSFSGNATITDDTSAEGVKSSYTATIPRSTSYSYGLDIIFGDISIGTVLQSLQSSSQGGKSAKIIMISAGYHFTSGGESQKADQTDQIDQTIPDAESTVE